MPLWEYGFELAAMAALIGASAFFSGSEAALFSVSQADRGAMGSGSPGERTAAYLLRTPERLLTAILFGNLVVNLTYYALTTIVSVRLERAEAAAAWSPTAFTLGALLVIILASEVLPKSLAVLDPRRVSSFVARPVAAVTAAIDPLLPWLESAGDAAARLLLPRLEPEPYLELADLERAAEFNTGETLDSESLLIQERQVLQRVVELADTTVAEVMRPRHRCLVYAPPVTLEDLRGKIDGVGDYLLVTEPDSDEVAGAFPLARLAMAPPDRIDLRIEPVEFVPWCASNSSTLELLRRKNRRVAVVINEFGETIGIVGVERLLDSVLRDAGQEDPHDAHAAWVRRSGPDAWESSAATPLRRLAKRLRAWVVALADEAAADDLADALIAARSRSVGGLLQEVLDRPPRLGDAIDRGGLRWTVTAGPSAEDEELATDNAPLVVRLAIAPTDDHPTEAEA
ncbi:MAG: CNNM domain-containing protein [Planctomycetota bacterium]